MPGGLSQRLLRRARQEVSIVQRRFNLIFPLVLSIVNAPGALDVGRMMIGLIADVIIISTAVFFASICS